MWWVCVEDGLSWFFELILSKDAWGFTHSPAEDDSLNKY
jgi:hypothetical protein